MISIRQILKEELLREYYEPIPDLNGEIFNKYKELCGYRYYSVYNKRIADKVALALELPEEAVEAYIQGCCDYLQHCQQWQHRRTEIINGYADYVSDVVKHMSTNFMETYLKSPDRMRSVMRQIMTFPSYKNDVHNMFPDLNVYFENDVDLAEATFRYKRQELLKQMAVRGHDDLRFRYILDAYENNVIHTTEDLTEYLSQIGVDDVQLKKMVKQYAAQLDCDYDADIRPLIHVSDPSFLKNARDIEMDNEQYSPFAQIFGFAAATAGLEKPFLALIQKCINLAVNQIGFSFANEDLVERAKSLLQTGQYAEIAQSRFKKVLLNPRNIGMYRTVMPEKLNVLGTRNVRRNPMSRSNSAQN